MKELEDALTITDIAKLMGVKKAMVTKYIQKRKLTPKYQGEIREPYFERVDVVSLKKNTLKFTEREHREFQGAKRCQPSLDELEVIQAWRVQKYDRGSVDVEIGLLSKQIEEISDELPLLQRNKRHFLRKREELIKAVGKRRRKLNFLKMTNTERYYKALTKLGMPAYQTG